MPDFVELASPMLDEEDKRAVLDVLDSGWLTMGEKVRAFETAFAAMHGVPEALALNSCTAALHLALLALGVGPGDEVLLPAVTFVATANAVLYTGATPVFMDIEDVAAPVLQPGRAAEYASPRTKAVIVMHYGGYAVDMAAWRRRCDELGLLLVADAAHAPGADFAAAHADAACFSFFPNKNMTTAEGGMLLLRDPQAMKHARSLRSHGMTTLTLERHRGHAYSYDVTALGYNYRMDEIRGALGLSQLKKLPAMNARRRELAARYRRLLENGPGVGQEGGQEDGGPRMLFDADWPTVAHLAVVLLPPGTNRTAVMENMRQRGVQSSIHYPPLHRFSHHGPLLGARPLPNTEEFCARALTLPLHPRLSEQDVDHVVHCLEQALLAAATAPAERP